MASRTLYPPIIDSYRPAFYAGGSCIVYFSLSKFNGSADIKTVQVAVMKQNNGLSVINPVDEISTEEGVPSIFRKNGKIIINKVPTKAGKNLYSFEIKPQDIKDGQHVGWIYKIQIRLSEVTYTGNGTDQSDWLVENAYHFSEQSTVCITKAVGKIGLMLAKPFDYDSSNANNVNNEEESTFSISSLEVIGNITTEKADDEKLYSYRIKLYDNLGNLVEDSGDLFSNSYQDSNEFYYYVKREFKDGEQYRFEFYYTTINGQNNYDEPYVKNFIVDQALSGTTIKVVTVDTVDDISELDYFGNESIHSEEEEGRIGLKILPVSDDYDRPYSGNLCIKRASEKDNFEQQIDIKIITINNEYIKNLDIYYDYMIESGVYYKYGVQEIDSDGFRTVLKINEHEIMRDFEYSFLVGEGGKQLKLKFDNTMSSYKIQQLESKLEPIGSKYPIITRNAAIEYRTFPIAGLISFQMDENHLFCSKKDIYKYNNVVDLHNRSRTKDRDIGDDVGHIPHTPGVDAPYSPSRVEIEEEEGEIVKKEYPFFNEQGTTHHKGEPFTIIDDTYNYTYERDYRKMVLDFLYDGKPKLFKSPTEGNIIVRLTDINCTPNQSLDRMLYSFTSNASELAEATMPNYLKYGFYEVGEWSDTLITGETRIGQLIMEFNKNINIIEEIFNKYAKEKANFAGMTKKIQKIFGIRITILDKPFKVLAPGTSDTYILGNNLKINYNNTGSNVITITNGIYEFDSRIEFTDANAEGLQLLGSADDSNKRVEACVDFFYEIATSPYKAKSYASKESIKGIGQIYDHFISGNDIVPIIKKKYLVEAKSYDYNLTRITSIEIETTPGAVFRIKDSSDTTDGNNHEVNTTGVLNFYNLGDILELEYKGMRIPNGDIDSTVSLDIMINYHYVLIKGVYKE